MDLNSLKDQVSNLTLYDLKAGVRKVQNGENIIGTTAEATADMSLLAVMNYTEMEAKVALMVSRVDEICSRMPQVREATNNEPWGASSSLMQEIANGTHS